MTETLQRVLCVEDDRDIQTILEISLRDLGGFDIKICDNGLAAVQTVKGFKPDIVLMDVMMPVMDGPTALQKLRQDPELAKIPVVFLTAKVRPHERNQYLGYGAVDIIQKPFDPASLATAVTNIWRLCHAKGT